MLNNMIHVTENKQTKNPTAKQLPRKSFIRKPTGSNVAQANRLRAAPRSAALLIWPAVIQIPATDQRMTFGAACLPN